MVPVYIATYKWWIILGSRGNTLRPQKPQNRNVAQAEQESPRHRRRVPRPSMVLPSNTSRRGKHGRLRAGDDGHWRPLLAIVCDSYRKLERRIPINSSDGPLKT